MGMGLKDLGAIALLALAAPALADVKAGVDAWAKGDWTTAINQWRQPAISGDADAQYNMGFAYKLGRGVPMDESIAQGWFRKAAMQGHAQAQASYGIGLFQGGKQADAVPWLEKAAAQDERRAELMLGTMLFNGDAVAKDWPRAYALVTRASQQGLAQAAPTLVQMDQYVPADQRERGTALAKQIESQAKFAALNAAPVVPAGGDMAAQPLAGATPAAKPAQVAAKAPAPAPAKPPKTLHATAPVPKPLPGARTAEKPEAAKPKVAEVAKPKAPETKAKPARPAPAPVAAGGKWRVQLGAFKETGAAQAQWAKLRGRMAGASPDYVQAGPVTRLQASGFASRAAADKACAAAKSAGAACLVIAP